MLGAAVAVSSATPVLEGMMNGSDSTASDDAGLLAVAEGLDAERVYPAWIARADFTAPGGPGTAVPAASTRSASALPNMTATRFSSRSTTK